MANNHIISIEREAKVSVNIGRIEINFPSTEQKHYFAPFDIAILILAHSCIQITGAAIKELSKNGALIMTVNDNFMPLALTVPLGINSDGARRPRKQANFINSEAQKMCWQQLVQAKILGQAKVLDLIDRQKAEHLRYNASKVLPADINNMESISAKIYWDCFFKHLQSPINTRQKQGAEDLINICLNYGYAIMRAIVARSLVSMGLCLNFGVGHHRKDNPFNLAEDFIEPFRYIVDGIVLNLPLQEYKEFNSELKKNILGEILKTTVEIYGKKYRLFQSVDFAANSFCNTLDDYRKKLLLPNMIVKRGVKPQMQEIFHTKYD